MINVSKEFLEEMKTRTDFKPAASFKLSDIYNPPKMSFIYVYALFFRI